MDLRRLKQRAGDLWGKGKIAQAEVLYRQMVTRQPNDAQLWVRHGEALKRLARGEDAVVSFRMAAQVLGQAGHFLRAVAALKMALALKPDDIDLVTDIIRLELQRARDEVRAPGPPVRRSISVELSLEGNDEAPRPLLALPMLEGAPAASSPSPPSPSLAYPQLRRLASNEVALKPAADAAWIVFKSDTNILVRFLEALEVEDPGVTWLG